MSKTNKILKILTTKDPETRNQLVDNLSKKESQALLKRCLNVVIKTDPKISDFCE